MNSYVWIEKNKIMLPVVIFLCLMYFLGSFSIFYKIPPDNELKKTAGNLIYENYDGRPKIAISTPEGKIYFTCQQPNDKGGSRIPITTKEAKSLEGKPVTIYWYRRLFFIGVYQNHIVKMQSENKMLVTCRKLIMSSNITAFQLHYS